MAVQWSWARTPQGTLDISLEDGTLIIVDIAIRDGSPVVGKVVDGHGNDLDPEEFNEDSHGTV